MRSRPVIRHGIGHCEEFSQYVAALHGTAGQLIDENRSLDAQIRATITWPEKNKEVLGRFGHFIAEGTENTFYGGMVPRPGLEPGTN
jgi:hypothetical protein